MMYIEHGREHLHYMNTKAYKFFFSMRSERVNDCEQH